MCVWHPVQAGLGALGTCWSRPSLSASALVLGSQQLHLCCLHLASEASPGAVSLDPPGRAARRPTESLLWMLWGTGPRTLWEAPSTPGRHDLGTCSSERLRRRLGAGPFTRSSSTGSWHRLSSTQWLKAVRRVECSSAGLSWALLVSTGCYWALLGPAGLCWALLQAGSLLGWSYSAPYVFVLGPRLRAAADPGERPLFTGPWGPRARPKHACTLKAAASVNPLMFLGQCKSHGQVHRKPRGEGYSAHRMERGVTDAQQ